VSEAHAGSAFDGEYVRVRDIGGAVAVCDDAGRVHALTPAAAALFERLDVPIPELPAPLPSSLSEAIDAVPAGEAAIWTPNGADDTSRLGCTRYALGEGTSVLVMKEVSEKYRALSARLDQERFEATHRLVASIAHDMRAPLGTILLNANTLKEQTKTASSDLRAAVDDIDLATNRLCRLIDGLLDFARIGPPVRDIVSIRDVLGAVTRILHPSIEAGNHGLSKDLASDALWVVANRFVLEQILVNLVLNSLQSDSESVTVELRTERVGDRIRVLVLDDGPGVPEEVRSSIFKRFYTTKPDGTGLGLTSSRESARQLGGDLWLDESADRTCFVLELPADPALPLLEEAGRR
jgi:signal transduction histidine kinase